MKEKYPKLKMIIVDDGSKDLPIEKALAGENLTDIILVKIKEDIGFNAHGARNLGMYLSKTEWNLLIDLDYNITDINLDNVLSLDPNNIYCWMVNTALIHKDVFWSVKGYDEDFVNIHFGDRIFFDNLAKKYNIIKMHNIMYYREGRTGVVSSRYLLTAYGDKLFNFQPAHTWNRLNELIDKVQLRYDSNDFSDKKILNFDWEIVKHRITLT